MASHSKTAEAKGQSNVGIGLLFRAMGRYPLFTFLFVLLGGGAAAAIWFFLPLPKMTASAIFQIQATPTPVFKAEGDEKIDFKLYAPTQAALIKNRVLLASAIKPPEINNLPILKEGARKEGGDPLVWLDNQLKLDFKLGPELMRLSLEGDNPDELNAVITAISDVYLKAVLTKDRSRRLARMEQLNKIYKVYENLLKNQRASMEILAQRSLSSTEPKIVEVYEAQLHDDIGAAQKEFSQLTRELLREEGDIKIHEKKIEAAGEVVVSKEQIDLVLQTDERYKQLKAKHSDIQASIDDEKKKLVPGVQVPRIAGKEKDLAQAQRDLEAYAATMQPKIVTQIRNNEVLRYKLLKQELEDRVASSKTYRQSLAVQLNELDGKAKLFKSDQIKLEKLKSEIGQYEKMADRILTDIETLRPELEATGRVNLWQEPIVVPGIEGSRRLKYSLMTGVGVLILGLVLITFLEYRNRRILHSEEVSLGLGLRVIGTIPALPRRDLSRNAAMAKGAIPAWRQQLAESADNTRTMLLHSLDGTRSVRTIMVTSAVSGEGKTSLAGHLAVSLARGGFKTILVDADMRRPSVHRILGIPLVDGLSEFLRDEATLEQVIRPAPAAGLWVIAAGSWHARLPQLLAGSAWATLKAQLEAEFDYVVVDTPPLLPVADALLMARHVDGVVLSLLRDVSRMSALTAAKDRLSAVGAHILGVVINGVASDSYGGYESYRAQSEFAESASRA